MDLSNEEIDARIKSLGRPTFVSFREALVSSAVTRMRALQAEFDAANPDVAVEYAGLIAEAERRAKAEEAIRYAEANRKRDVDMVRRMAGDRIADNIQAPREEAPLIAARQWLASEDWCLSLYGTAGNGKTFAAAWAVLQSTFRPVVWLHSPSACARPLYGPEALANCERAQKAPLFVLDEFGAEMASAGWQTWLEAVLGVRYARKLKTIITSNLNAEGYKARLGERLTDRVREGRVFESSGKSLRSRGGK